MKNTRLFGSTALALGGAVATLVLVSCDKHPSTASNTAMAAADNGVVPPTDPGLASADTATPPAGALPLAQTPAPPPAAPAPAAAALPPAPPAQVAPPAPPAQQFSYVDQAATMSSAFANSPPDYAVPYQGARPWVWRGQNGAYRVVEQIPGGQRYYYYHPGSRAPFLVRDSQYTYAYDGGRLAVVYDAGGRPLAAALAARQAELAGRYLARAQALYLAATQGQRQAAYAADWQARRDALAAQQLQWQRDQQQNAQWRAWHDQHAAAEQSDWARESAERRAYAAQLARARTSGALAQRAADQNQMALQQRQDTARLARERQDQPGGEPGRPGPPVAPAPRPLTVAQARARQARVTEAREALAKAQASHVEPPERRQALINAAQARLREALGQQARVGG